MTTRKQNQGTTGNTTSGDQSQGGGDGSQDNAPALAFPESAASVIYDNLEVQARHHAGDGLYYFGVVLNGAFIPLSASKAGYVDEELREAATPGYKQAKLREYQVERLGIG